MKLSVIIPTYQRSETLLQSIASLQHQSLSNFEIIVVDNAVDVKLEQRITSFNQSAKFKVRYIPESFLGAHHARHTGAQAAVGELLVFTDDDATFTPHWLESYQKSFFNHPKMVAAGGAVRPVWQVPPPQWLLDYIGEAKLFTILSLMEPATEFYLDPKGFFFSVNMAIKRKVLFEVGGFNPDLVDEFLLGDGETGLYYKLWQRELLIGYVPDALVYHHIPKSRMTIDYFRHRMANEGASDMYSLYHQGISHPLLLIFHMVWITIRNKFWIDSLLLNGGTDKLSIDIQTNAAKTKAQVKYIFRLLIDDNFRELVTRQDWLAQHLDRSS